MKHIFTLLLLLCSVTNAAAQFGLGLRDTRFVNVNYTFANHYNVELEHSFYNEAFKLQHLRLSFTYMATIKHFTIKCKPYFGITYNAAYHDAGALVNAAYRIGRVGLDATLNPHYDSGLKYKTCWGVGASCRVYKQLSIVAQYTTVPEYRQSENRFRAGFRIDVDRLWVMPLLSTCVDRFDKWKTKGMRVSVSMGWHL